MSNTLVENYYNHICQEWGVTPTSSTYTGYETVEQQLKSYSKEVWTQADDTGKDKIVDDVFNIYRSINIIPITYFTLDGCKEELKTISLKTEITRMVLSLKETSPANGVGFWSMIPHYKHYKKVQEIYAKHFGWKLL